MAIWLNEEDVRAVLRLEELIECIEGALAAFSAGQVRQPVRTVIEAGLPGTFFAETTCCPLPRLCPEVVRPAASACEAPRPTTPATIAPSARNAFITPLMLAPPPPIHEMHVAETCLVPLHRGPAGRRSQVTCPAASPWWGPLRSGDQTPAPGSGASSSARIR